MSTNTEADSQDKVFPLTHYRPLLTIQLTVLQEGTLYLSFFLYALQLPTKLVYLPVNDDHLQAGFMRLYAHVIIN